MLISLRRDIGSKKGHLLSRKVFEFYPAQPVLLCARMRVYMTIILHLPTASCQGHILCSTETQADTNTIRGSRSGNFTD